MPDTSKRDRILTGLRNLCAEQRPGQTYSAAAIAERCGCTKENIEQIERKAKERVGKRLISFARELDLTLPAKKGGIDAAR